ncbi:MAG: modification methylase [Phycisphaerales bacterium]|jgi:site-specific DNA-methyltransferase (adenine-specific)|nr:modification methylase [Phycisphaerales bacterium]
MTTIGPFALNRVHCTDAIAAMRLLPHLCCDLAIADPPYNLSKGGDWKWDQSVKLPGFGGKWQKVMESWDNMELVDYLQFTVLWLAELKRVVRPTGSIWIHGTYHNIGIINFALQLLSIEIINEVVWYKRNSFPNLSGRRLTASHETILWCHTGKQREYLFNYDKSKEMPCPEDALKEPGKQMRTVWDIPNNKSADELLYGKHPTQKPVRLLKRLIALSARKGQVCLVPFAGAGSECVAAQQSGLDFLGFEIDRQYAAICAKRFAPATKQIATLVRRERTIPSLLKWTGSKRSQAASIAGYFPPFTRYIEPFLGGGALLYLAAHEGAIATDVYPPLMEFWKLVQSDVQRLIKDYAGQWKALQKSLPDYFYVVRERYNRSPNALDLNFLMRTCVNGIVRFNDDGKFNNSFHLSRPGMSPEKFEQVALKWHERIQGVVFRCQSYQETLKSAAANDFIYLDPPYAGNQQRYCEDLKLDAFWKQLDRLNSRGVKWALSFDGHRGTSDLTHPVPKKLFQRKLLLPSGNSPVGKVLNGSVERVLESLYLNY